MNLVFKKSTEKELDRLQTSFKLHILKLISLLATDPYPQNSKKLTNLDQYRLRSGDYRILYQIDTKRKEITITAISHRKDAYRL